MRVPKHLHNSWHLQTGNIILALFTLIAESAHTSSAANRLHNNPYSYPWVHILLPIEQYSIAKIAPKQLATQHEKGILSGCQVE